jgi:flagellar FliJ protein
MKRFSFQFEQLLRVREFAENTAKEALGRETAALSELEHQIALNERQCEAARVNRFAKERSVSDMSAYDFYIMRLDNERARLQKEAQAQSGKVDEAREAYIEASREKKIIDKLKDKRIKAYKKEAQKDEEAEIDDIGGRRGQTPANRL